MSRTPRIETHRSSPSVALPGVDFDDRAAKGSEHPPGRNEPRRRGGGSRRPAMFIWVALAALIVALVIAFDPFGLRIRPIAPLVPPAPTRAPLQAPQAPAEPVPAPQQ